MRATHAHLLISIDSRRWQHEAVHAEGELRIGDNDQAQRTRRIADPLGQAVNLVIESSGVNKTSRRWRLIWIRASKRVWSVLRSGAEALLNG